jgi:hypothetical protein
MAGHSLKWSDTLLRFQRTCLEWLRWLWLLDQVDITLSVLHSPHGALSLFNVNHLNSVVIPIVYNWVKLLDLFIFHNLFYFFHFLYFFYFLDLINLHEFFRFLFLLLLCIFKGVNGIDFLLSGLVWFFIIFNLLENAKTESFLAVEVVFLLLTEWFLRSGIVLFRLFTVYFLNTDVKCIDVLLTFHGRLSFYTRRWRWFAGRFLNSWFLSLRETWATFQTGGTNWGPRGRSRRWFYFCFYLNHFSLRFWHFLVTFLVFSTSLADLLSFFITDDVKFILQFIHRRTFSVLAFLLGYFELIFWLVFLLVFGLFFILLLLVYIYLWLFLLSRLFKLGFTFFGVCR